MSPRPDSETPGAPDPRMTSFGFRKPRIFPPIWLIIAIAAMYALNRWLPLAQLNTPMTSWSSWLLFAPGLAIDFIAVGGFRRAKTGAIPFSESTALVTTGLYRFTRNPMYLGMALILAGVALKMGSLGAWISMPLFVWVIHRQFILNEEIFLAAIYGDEYRQYCQRVRRWI
ncbi:MAG: methyltransferase family protein [Lysobacterales bacterium]